MDIYAPLKHGLSRCRCQHFAPPQYHATRPFRTPGLAFRLRQSFCSGRQRDAHTRRLPSLSCTHGIGSTTAASSLGSRTAPYRPFGARYDRSRPPATFFLDVAAPDRRTTCPRETSSSRSATPHLSRDGCGMPYPYRCPTQHTPRKTRASPGSGSAACWRTLASAPEQAPEQESRSRSHRRIHRS